MMANSAESPEFYLLPTEREKGYRLLVGKIALYLLRNCCFTTAWTSLLGGKGVENRKEFYLSDIRDFSRY